jgi:small subunit ribosomal protein S14
MAFSVLRNFASRMYNGILKETDAIRNFNTLNALNDLTLLSNCNKSSGQITSIRWRTRRANKKKIGQYPPDLFLGKPAQDWWDWDGFGPYKPRYHKYPTNWTLRDVQRRRIFLQHAEERNRLTSIFRNDILPQELKDVAREEIHKVPRASAITRINRRCSITGRGKGVFHQFRVSRMVFRAEADYNKISGVQRANWIKTIHIDP